MAWEPLKHRKKVLFNFRHLLQDILKSSFFNEGCKWCESHKPLPIVKLIERKSPTIPHSLGVLSKPKSAYASRLWDRGCAFCTHSYATTTTTTTIAFTSINTSIRTCLGIGWMDTNELQTHTHWKWPISREIQYQQKLLDAEKCTKWDHFVCFDLQLTGTSKLSTSFLPIHQHWPFDQQAMQTTTYWNRS